MITKEGAVRPKPFLKWVGGKRQLMSQLEEHFPKTFESYFEPFFGGGAVYFHLVPVTGYINDVNKALTGAYKNIRNNVEELIQALTIIENEYLPLNEDLRKEYFYERRFDYNAEKPNTIRKSALLIFLNRTCFNGLYRENRKGEFNVPFGRSKNPTICDADNLRSVSRALKYVEILNGSYELALGTAKKGDFVYLDPPYDPINSTSSFTSYSVDDFTKDDQKKLKTVFDELTSRGCLVALSNSDTPFMRELYKEYRQETLMASRSINAKGTGRGKITELLVLNY